MLERVAGFMAIVGIGLLWASVCRGADGPEWPDRADWPGRPDWAALLDRSDVFYHIPTERHEDGLPIGNGDLGTMLWTPTLDGGLMFQLNKADAWSCDNRSSITNSLPSLVRLVVKTSRPMQKDAMDFLQHLSLKDGMVYLHSRYAHGQCTGRVFISAVRPVLVVELSDTRPGAAEMTAALTLWRMNLDTPEAGGAKFVLRNDCAVLVQEYKTPTYFLRYAVAISSMATAVKTGQDEPRMAFLKVAPGQDQRAVILAAVAMTKDPNQDVAQMAADELARARAAGLDALVKEHVAWWRDFWSRHGTYVHLTSPDGVADYLETIWHLCLYQTACSSRGAYPPKFNGGIWLGDRDFRAWGGPYWLWNTESMYFPLPAQNAFELAEPFYNMYWNQLPAARLAARQRWNCGGAFFCEVLPYDGFPELTEQQARDALRNNLEKPVCGFGAHIMSSGCEIAWAFWRKYAYTGDEVWLKDRAYPFMKEIALFYLDYFKKGDDGLYHIFPTNAHEAFWCVKDGIMDIAAVRWLLPRVIETSGKLNVDADLRSRCQEMLDHLAPYPTAETPGAQELWPIPPGTFAPGLLGLVKGCQNAEATRVTPVWPFEDIAVGASSEELLTRARKSLESEQQWGAVMNGPTAIAWSRIPIMTARLGMAGPLKEILTKHAICAHVYPAKADFDHEMGIVRGEYSQIISTAVDEALLQSHHGLIQLFPAWPDGWDARFRLLAEGNVMVESAKVGGTIPFVSLQANLAGKITLANPWKGQEVSCQAGGKATMLKGERLVIDAQQGAVYLLSPAGAAVKAPPAIVIPPRTEEIKRIRFVKDGKVLYQSKLGLTADDVVKRPAPATLPAGPVELKSEADVTANFIADRYGENQRDRLGWSDKYGPAMCLTTTAQSRSGIRLYANYVGNAGAVQRPTELENVVVEAEFIPENTRWFGFSRTNASATTGIYRACLDFNDPNQAYLRLDCDEPGSERFFRRAPVPVTYEDGKAYRLRLTVRNTSGPVLRYTTMKLELMSPEDPFKPVGAVGYPLNLTGDNLSDRGNAGIYVFHEYLKPGQPERRLHVRNLSILLKD